MGITITQAIPFFWVTDIQASVSFYVDGLGFEMKNQWINKGKLAWCWLQTGDVAIMLQEYTKARIPDQKKGVGVSINFNCTDSLAVYQELAAKGISAREPFVGNGLWVTHITDPDGYELYFNSPTDVAEETTLSQWKALL